MEIVLPRHKCLLLFFFQFFFNLVDKLFGISWLCVPDQDEVTDIFKFIFEDAKKVICFVNP
jgi:hypothetical protein